MGKQTGIEWCDATWNPWYGCRKVSPGCKFCYAERDMTRYGRNFGEVTRAKDATFRAPLKWKEPRRIFACSWSDWFIQEADAWRDEAWEIIRQTPQHTYLILTKRPRRIVQDGVCRLPWKAGEEPWPNVWLGVSVENQDQLWQRGPYLLQLPAAVRFVSNEPALEMVNFYRGGPAYAGRTAWADGLPFRAGISWWILGGESGPKAREFKIEWAYETLAQGRAAGVPCFIKQLGSNPTWHGKRIKFRDPKGADMAEWPEALRVREFPKLNQ